MIVINTTKDEISVSIKGIEYVLEPEGKLEGVPADAAEYWVTKLHQFLIVKPEEGDKQEVEESPQRVDDIEEAEKKGEMTPEEAEAAKKKAEADAKAAEEAAKKAAEEAAKEEANEETKEEEKEEEKDEEPAEEKKRKRGKKDK